MMVSENNKYRDCDYVFVKQQLHVKSQRLDDAKIELLRTPNEKRRTRRRLIAKCSLLKQEVRDLREMNELYKKQGYEL